VNLILTAVIVAGAALIIQRVWRYQMLERRVGVIRAHAFPQSVRMKFRDAQPDLDSTREQRVFDGLRDYFVICAQARGRFVAMPSQVADDAWHAMILHTRHYQEFCNRHSDAFCTIHPLKR